MNNKFGTTLKKFAKHNVILLVLLGLIILSAIFVKGFTSAYNIGNYITAVAPLLVVACGVTFAVLNGGIDFSSTSIITLGSVIGAYLMVKTPLGGSIGGIIVAILLILAIGAFVGAINGFAVSVLKMPSFIATMSTMMIGQGIAVLFASIYYDKASLNGLPDAFLWLGGGTGYSIWVPLIISLAVLIFTHWLMRYTVFGRKLYAVGTNPKTSFISGTNVKKTVFMMMFLSGVYAALASVLYTAKNQAGIPSLGDKLFIDIIASIVIGGTSIAGGFGGVRQTFIGVMFLVLIDNVMNLLGVTWYIILVIKGLLIVVAAFIDYFSKKPEKAKKVKTQADNIKKVQDGIGG